MSTPSALAPTSNAPASTTSGLRARTVDTLPQIDRPDAGLVAITEFTVGSPERLQALLDASAAAWTTLPWPETLLSITWLASLDGQKALAYVQWRDDSEFESYGRIQRPALAAHFTAAVPDLQPVPPVFYTRYRSGVRPDPPVPGCIVIVSIEFEGADAARQRAWIDTVFEAIEAEPVAIDGGISGHFHTSVDGTRALNYAEWTDEAAHQAALDRSGRGTIGAGAKWQAVRDFPGVKASGFTRYRFVRRLIGA
jgi:hypothetical protein